MFDNDDASSVFFPPKFIFTVPSRISQTKQHVEWQQHLFGTERREGAQPALNPIPRRIFKESLDKSEQSGPRLIPPPTPVTARLSSALTFKNTAFTAKRELYGVINNTEIPVKSDTERVGAPGGFLCRGHLKQVGRVSNPAGCWDFTADTTPLIGFKEYVKKIIECSAVISVRGRYQTDINLGLLCYQMERVSRSPLKSHYCLGSIMFLSGVYRQQDIW